MPLIFEVIRPESSRTVDAHRVALGQAVEAAHERPTLVVDGVDILDPSQMDARAAGLVGVDVAGVVAPDEERRLAAGEIGLEHGLGLDRGPLAVAPEVVDEVAVGGDDGADVLGGLHPAFDLEGLDAHLDEIGNIVDQLQIVGREEIALLRLGFVEAAARLGAGAAVGALSAQIGGEEADARGRHAERAVDEDFELHAGILADRPDFLEREFPGQHGALEALPGDEVAALRGGDVHLRGRVQGQRGEAIPGHLHHAEVLDDDAVRLEPVEVLEELVDPVGLPVLEDGIDGDVHLLAPLVDGLEAGLELVEGEIGRTHAGVEGAQPEVHRVGAFADGGVERFRRSRRRK